jgi:CheY-like chemotaxis protein
VPTILVVDDTADNRELLTTILQTAGFTVIEAVNGAEALEAALRNPALVFLDLLMPELDGFEVCRRLRANPATRHIPICAMSAVYSGASERRDAFAAGADGFLSWPSDPEQVVAMVRTLLRKASPNAS